MRRAEQAVEWTNRVDAAALDTLAAAYAARRDFDRAIATAEQALEAAQAADQTALAQEIAARLELYRTGEPFIHVHAASPQAESR